jgi:hypothetical protein
MQVNNMNGNNTRNGHDDDDNNDNNNNTACFSTDLGFQMDFRQASRPWHNLLCPPNIGLLKAECADA